MSDEGIRQFQELLEDEAFPVHLAATASHVLWQAGVIVGAVTTPRTWQLLNMVVDRLRASSPWVSDEPIHVKAREVAPHIIKELWCESGRIEAASADVCKTLTPGAALEVYTECHMDNGNLELDSRHGLGKGTVIDHLRLLCQKYANRVLNELAYWDLDADK
jgi:hypothetical protein